MKNLPDKKMAAKKTENEPTETRTKTTNPKNCEHFFEKVNSNLKQALTNYYLYDSSSINYLYNSSFIWISACQRWMSSDDWVLWTNCLRKKNLVPDCNTLAHRKGNKHSISESITLGKLLRMESRENRCFEVLKTHKKMAYIEKIYRTFESTLILPNNRVRNFKSWLVFFHEFFNLNFKTPWNFLNIT